MKPTKTPITVAAPITKLSDLPSDIGNRRVISRTPSQIARSDFMESLLQIGPTGTALYTTEEIAERVSEKFPDWDEELKLKGYDLDKAEKRKIVAVHRKCEDMLKRGISAGFLPRGGRRADVKKMPYGVEYTSIGRIMTWFRNPENIQKLSWRECEEIISYIHKYRNQQAVEQAPKKLV